MASSNRQPRKWTPLEDQKLREEVEAQVLASGEVKDWCKIANRLPGRTNKDCRKRWHNSVAGGLKKGQWSKSEDMLLASGVEQYGQRWTLVANCVESRSADQCAKRWQQSLDPDLDHSEWREEEDRTLIDATQELGRHWKDIQREHFPGRSKNCIKNRYTVLVRRYQNIGIALPSRPSSPSGSNTPVATSPYLPEDEDQPLYFEDPFGHLMPPQASSQPRRNHRSWPGYESNPQPWSNAQHYNMQLSASPPEFPYAQESLPDSAFQDPGRFSAHAPSASIDAWDWQNAHMDTFSSLHTKSPVPYYSAPQHYDDYSMTRPVTTSSRSYSISPGRADYHNMPNQTCTNVARSSSWPEQQHYYSLSPASYEDPRLQRNFSYKY